MSGQVDQEKLKSNQDDRVGVIVPAPLIYLACLIVGLLIGVFHPIRLALPNLVTIGIGLVFIVAAGVIVWLSIPTMRKAGISTDPSRPPMKLVVGGPFRFSRNPIYVSLALGYTGITIGFNSLFSLLLLILALLAVNYFVISREEKYLEKKFGEEYLSYKSRVRRWL